MFVLRKRRSKGQIGVSFSYIIFCPLCLGLTLPPSASSCLHRLSLPSFPSRFHEQHSSEHKEGHTDQSNHRVKELWPTRRSQVPGSKVKEDNRCGVGGNFLPQGTGACGECVFTYYLASAFTPMVTQHKMVKHQTYCQMVDGVSYDCATHIPNY